MKANFPSTAKNFQIPIYGGLVYLFRSEAVMNKALNYLNFEGNNDVVGGRCMQLKASDGAALYLVGWYTKDFSTLVHECGHLAMYILERAGIDARHDSGEAYCYLIEELVRQCGIDKKPRVRRA